jgi:hypothetical protein
MLISCSPPMGVTAGLPNYTRLFCFIILKRMCSNIMGHRQRTGPLYTYGIYMEIYGNRMEYIWKPYGIYMGTYGTVWKILGNVWKTYVCSLRLVLYDMHMFCWHRSFPLCVWVPDTWCLGELNTPKSNMVLDWSSHYHTISYIYHMYLYIYIVRKVTYIFIDTYI